MRNRLAATILTAAVAGVLTPAAFTLAQPAPAAAPQPADKQAPIPVRQVVLYSSGVGYFEHFGTVEGNGATELRFKTAQINDILKSLVLQDLDKGKVGVITYPSQDPVAKTLRSFQIDITTNPSLADLLNQLRGARVTLTVGAAPVAGTVLGVERKPRTVGSGDGAKVVEQPFLNLVVDGVGIRSVALDEVKTFELADPRLREELTRALAALAAARDTDKKPVTINYTGDGQRRLRIGYVVETPVWKTSYRLSLGGPAVGGPAVGGPAVGGPAVGGPAADKPAAGDAKPATAPATRPGVGQGALQGWAIVENQTDNDWNDVQLSLVSGRPISFIQDLYQPLYIPRPVVQPELYASLRPQTYDAGLNRDRALQSFNSAPASPPAPTAAAAAPGLALAQREEMAKDARSDRDGVEKRKSAVELGYLDPMSSVSSVASAAKLGELFQYTVGNVSLPRQTSAMIPVVTDPVEVEKLSIFNMSVLAKNPLLGARVKNTTGKHLLQGPITVLADGKYAGDARIDDVPPGQERLISYGIDQQIVVVAKNNQQANAVLTGKIVKGVLFLTRKLVIDQTYTAENKGDSDKTLLIEHPRRGGGWKLVAPAKADETTDNLYRFKGVVAAGKGTELVVREELINVERMALLNVNDLTLATYARTGEIPQAVRDAMTKAISLRQALAQTQQQMAEKAKVMDEITKEQNRLRDNMKTVAQNTDYYQRLLKKLGDQETQIEGLQKNLDELRATAEQQRKALNDYVSGLNVE